MGIHATSRVPEQELSQKLELAAGARFNVRQWIEDRHRLENFYLERGYQRVRIASTRSQTADPSHVSLTYDIERGPRTIIEVRGDQLPDEFLDAMYDAWRGLPIADVVRTEFERIARQGLARRGYYRPALQLEFSAETSDLALVAMHVSRGPQTKRLVIAWRGNLEVSIPSSTHWSCRISLNRRPGWIRRRWSGKSGSSTRPVDTSGPR